MLVWPHTPKLCELTTRTLQSLFIAKRREKRSSKIFHSRTPGESSASWLLSIPYDDARNNHGRIAQRSISETLSPEFLEDRDGATYILVPMHEPRGGPASQAS